MNSHFSLYECASYEKKQTSLNSNDSLLSIVFYLMNYSVIDEVFAKRAIESLVKKLKEKKTELDLLIEAITTRGKNLTSCVTISRTLDNRLQIAGKKGFPHVFYVKVWRWPDVHRNDLKHVSFCKHPFDSKSSLICVNPYHYERIVFFENEIINYSPIQAPIIYNALKKEKNKVNYRSEKLTTVSSDYWCSFSYFELDEQIGETFKVLNKFNTVTIDGYVYSNEENRFCLGVLSNVHRTEKMEKVRLHIGKGIRLSIVENGDVYLECLSDQPVFVQSYYLDRQVGRTLDFLVHKFHRSAIVKVFDFEQIKSLMKQKDFSYDKEHLRRLCMLRLSFVKGWGLDYIRKYIEETPCWIEIKLHKALQLIDES